MVPVQRPSVRVLPVNRAGQVLLLLGRDPARPDNTYWLTIGGGVDLGENLSQAAARELHEETGIRIDVSQLVGPFHRAIHAFSYAGVDYLSDSTFFAVAVDDVTVTFAGLEAEEVDNILEARWWRPADLVDGMTSSDLDLPAVARAAVAAIRIPQT
jgi:8-oxo-dGTP pyrophosphatase MutT (NUDIX family)